MQLARTQSAEYQPNEPLCFWAGALGLASHRLRSRLTDCEALAQVAVGQRRSRSDSRSDQLGTSGPLVRGTMARNRRHLSTVAAAACCLLAAGLVAASAAQPAQADSTCGTVTTTLVPACGAWWGIAANPQSYAQVSHLEGEMGRQFDTVYDFHTVGDTLPTPGERQLVSQGRILHINLETTKYSWSQIASGDADARLTAQAQGVASLRQRVFINFDHEPDAAKKAVRGTPANFVAAYRHVHQLFLNEGASNTVWIWVVTGWKNNFGALLSLYPGNDVVDWISWEAYTQVGCPAYPTLSSRASFVQNVSPMYNWLHSVGAQGGIDATKPIMISEYDATYNTPDPNVTANWYAGISAALQSSFPQIKAIQKWDVAGNCRYPIDTDPIIMSAMRTMGQDPYFNQVRPS